MCIIAFKEKGMEPLGATILQRCWNKNSDGAGFAYLNSRKTWNVEKGLMTYKDFWNAYDAHKFTKNDVVIVHFRVGTSGNRKGPDCTHPFVIKTGKAWEDEDEKYLAEMRKTEYTASAIAFHNGVVGTGEGINSDTMLAVKDWIAPLHNIMVRPKILDIMMIATECSTSRWLVTKGPQVYLLGKWITDKETGIIYSNDGFKPPVVQPIINKSRGKKGLWNQVNDPKYVNPITGDFDWDLWAKDYPSSTHKIESPDQGWENLPSRWAGVSPSSLGGSEFIVDDDGTPIGLIDYEGNIILDDEYFAFDANDKQADEMSICPQCAEEHHLVETPYVGTGDTMCQKCGCVFFISTGEKCMNDPDIHKMWLQSRGKEAADGNC
jgi:hypothetical protein